MESLTNIYEGLKCSVIIEVNGVFRRRNGIVDGKISHLVDVWSVKILNPCKGEPFYVKAFEKYFEILEPMEEYERLINALDEL